MDELDDDLLLELNQVVHDNQLAYLPFARSGRAESLLFDKYPELAERIERGKRAKIDAIVLSNKFSDDGVTATSFRAQSLEEISASPLRNRSRRKVTRETRADPGSPAILPALRDKSSVADLMFEMSDGEDEDSKSKGRIQPPLSTKAAGEMQALQTPVGSPEENWAEVRRKSRSGSGIQETNPLQTPSPSVVKEMRTPGRPWGVAPLEGTKLDLKDIMTQASTDKLSNLTLGLSKQEDDKRFMGSINAKMTQKERKRHQQAQQLGIPATIEKPQPTPPAVSPWQAVSRKSSSTTAIPSLLPARTSSTPQLTMRQTIANNGTSSKAKSHQGSQQLSRAASSSTPSTNLRPPSSGPGMSVSTNPIPTPHSVRHIPLPSHSPTSPSQHLSMMEILSLQEAEKVYIRDAATRRSLQEIQQEQEFQEWWDQESRRVMLEEEQQKRTEERSKASRGRGKARGRGGKTKGKERKVDVEGSERGSRDVSVAPTPNVEDASPMPRSETKPENSDRRRGRGKGGRGGRGVTGRGGRGQGPDRDVATPSTPGVAKERSKVS